MIISTLQYPTYFAAVRHCLANHKVVGDIIGRLPYFSRAKVDPSSNLDESDGEDQSVQADSDTSDNQSLASDYEEGSESGMDMIT